MAITMTMEKVLLLRQMDMFKKVSDGALADLISVSQEKTFKSGEVLADEKTQMAWYIILDGSVQEQKGNSVVKTIEAFDSIGLDLVFAEERPDIKIVAHKKTIALCVEKDALYRMFVLHPSLFFMCMAALSKKDI